MIWKAHSTDRACLRRSFHPMEVRRCPRNPELEGVQLWVPRLFLLPGACLTAHHREGRLNFLKKRSTSCTVDRYGTACSCHFTTNLEAVAPCGRGEFIIMSNITWTVGANVAGFSISWLESPKLCSRRSHVATSFNC